MDNSQTPQNQMSDARMRELQYKRNNGEALTQDENRFLDNLEQGKVGVQATADQVKNLEARKKNGEVLTPEEEDQLTRGQKAQKPDAQPRADNSSGPKDGEESQDEERTNKGPEGTVSPASKRSK